MKLIIDTETREITRIDGEESDTYDLYSKKAFELISSQWVNVGWDQKYSYTFSWFGRPIIQLPEDMVRTQEVIWSLKPDLIIETGIAHGGSLIYYASLFEALGHGRVLGVDIEIREENLKELKTHQLSSRIDLIIGDSISDETLSKVEAMVREDEKVLVILDSNHSYDHVLAELEAYHHFVKPGGYIVATDGVMKDLSIVPRGAESWTRDNPYHAAQDFVAKRDDFVIEQPAWYFNESSLNQNITHWPGAWLRKL
jgi:cephalosporin hydroxylase